jgi:hypothetical protein
MKKETSAPKSTSEISELPKETISVSEDKQTNVIISTHKVQEDMLGQQGVSTMSEEMKENVEKLAGTTTVDTKPESAIVETKPETTTIDTKPETITVDTLFQVWCRL